MSNLKFKVGQIIRWPSYPKYLAKITGFNFINKEYQYTIIQSKYHSEIGEIHCRYQDILDKHCCAVVSSNDIWTKLNEA